MREYEIVREIFNACSGSRNAAISIEEARLEDPETWLREQFPRDQVRIDRISAPAGAECFQVTIAGLPQTYTFTEL